MQTDHQLLDPQALGKLKWRCRRGLLENDLFIERFFKRHEAALTQRQARGLTQLTDLSDNDLMDLLLGRQEPTQDLATEEVREVLKLLRQPPDVVASSL
ncbi:MAG: succinate dehydrogenase assembly factor 2 [Comamonas sp.]